MAYQTAYLKAHYGPEYMAASMTSKMGKTEDIVTIIQECKRLGIPVLSPDINSSQGIFTANTKHQILFGLAGIRNVGIGVVEDVVAAREKGGPFKSIFDFCKRVAEYQGSLKEKRPPLSKKTLECLIMAGALDGLPGSRAVLMATVDRALEVAARYQEDKSKGQMSLFDMGGADSSISNIAEVLEEAEEWGSVEMLNKEREVLGLCLSGHPLDEFRPELIGFTTCSLSQEELARKEAAWWPSVESSRVCVLWKLSGERPSALAKCRISRAKWDCFLRKTPGKVSGTRFPKTTAFW